MRMRSFRYLSKEGIKNIWVNRLMSLASVGILVACMLIIGVFIIISVNADKALGALEQQNVVMVYFNDRNSVKYDDQNTANNYTSVQTTSSQNSGSTANEDEIPYDAYLIHNEEEALALCDTLRQIANVASVDYISSEQGLANLKASMSEEQAKYFTFLDEEGENPLSAGARVTMTDLSLFDRTLADIEATPGVSSTQSQGDLAEKITSIKHGLTVAGAWIIGLLLVISLVIVSNTIRVTMYNRRLEISIMKAVGATNSFIRFPFVVEGITMGAISALVTTGLLYFAYKAVLETMKSAFSLSSVVPFNDFVWPLAGLFAGIGVLAGLIGSFFMIGKYLRKEGSEFKAL